MINQHQFQQSAKHYRSGRISLSEFQSRVFAGLETNPTPNQKRDSGLAIERGDTNAVIGKTLSQLISDGQPVLVTGIGNALAEQLSQQFPGGEYDSQAQTFTFKSEATDSLSNGNLAVVAVVNVDAKFETGYLATVVAADKQA